MGPYKPLRTWVDEFIPYYIYGNFLGVDRPDRTFGQMTLGKGLCQVPLLKGELKRSSFWGSLLRFATVDASEIPFHSQPHHRLDGVF